jgi:hypothetical protein
MTEALVFSDGFDKYGPPGNLSPASVMVGDFQLVAGNCGIVAGLSSQGYALLVIGSNPSTVANVRASLSRSLGRLVGTFRFSQATNTGHASGITFFNGASACCSIIYAASSPRIELRTGAYNGTLINSGGAPAVSTTNVVTFDITFGPAAAYSIYINGVLAFSGTGNTGNGNTTANTVSIVVERVVNVGNTFVVDDFAVYDPTQAGYNSAILTANAVVETQFETGDAQTQFTNDGDLAIPVGLVANGLARTASNTNAPGANFIFLTRFTASATRTFNSVSCLPGATSATAKFKAVLYADSGGSIGSLLSSGNEVVGCTNGATLTGTLVTPQTVTAGQSYWMGFITDTSVLQTQYDATTNLGQKKLNTYTSGAPAGPLTGMTTAQPTWFISGNCTGSTVNFVAVGRNPPAGTSNSQIHSSTVAQEDLYSFPALVTTPTVIFGGAVKGFVSKSDSGGRTVSFNMKSGGVDSTGSNPGQGMSTTNQWQSTYVDKDPATGAAWTQSGVNAASSGVSVAS